jgi:hypothetical protein
MSRAHFSYDAEYDTLTVFWSHYSGSTYSNEIGDSGDGIDFSDETDEPVSLEITGFSKKLREDCHMALQLLMPFEEEEE